MAAFFDVRCPQCSHAVFWEGRVTDRPPCPRCGHRPDPADLERAEAEVARARACAAEDAATRAACRNCMG